MQIRKRLKQAMPVDTTRLTDAYRQVVSSLREARSVQPAQEKERQMQRLMRYMCPADPMKP